jgi:hypothetical protein
MLDFANGAMIEACLFSSAPDMSDIVYVFKRVTGNDDEIWEAPRLNCPRSFASP